MSKFACKCCNEEIEVLNYSMTVLEGKAVYLEKATKKKLLCNRGSALFPIDNSFKGVPMINSFGSLSKQDKSKALLKRSQDHFKKEVKEQKYQMNKKLINDFNSQS